MPEAPLPPAALMVTAAAVADWTRVLVLLRAGASPTVADDEGATLLHLALLQGRAEMAAVLIEFDAPVQAVDRYGRTPLHYLAETAADAPAVAAADLVARLVARGADPNHTDGRGRTPLHAAAVRGHAAVAAALLAAGARVEAVKADGQTPLHLAVTRNHGQLVDLLLRRGADPDRPAADGVSARVLARKLKRLDLLARFPAPPAPAAPRTP